MYDFSIIRGFCYNFLVFIIIIIIITDFSVVVCGISV